MRRKIYSMRTIERRKLIYLCNCIAVKLFILYLPSISSLYAEQYDVCDEYIVYRMVVEKEAEIHRDPVPRPSVISKIIKNCYLALSLYIFFYFGSILSIEKYSV